MARPGHSSVRTLGISFVLALALIGGLRVAVAALQPVNSGMVDRPCPAQDKGWFHQAWLVLRALGGDTSHRNDWLSICAYDADNRARIAAGKQGGVVFIGDSMTHNWQQIQPELFGDQWVNRCISAQSSAQVLGRFQADVVALKPQFVHILIGTNDVNSMAGPSSPEFFKGNIRAMVDIARANRIGVVLGTISPLDGEAGKRVREVNAWLRQFTFEQNLGIADYYTALAAPDGTLKPQFRADEIHVSAPAYSVMTPIAKAAIAELAKASAQ